MSVRERDTPVRGERYGFTAGLSQDGDVIINSDGTVRRKYDEAAVVQDLKVILLSYVGDDIFRPELGVDVLAATGTTDARLKLEIRKAIGPNEAGIERVESVDSIDIDRALGSREDVVVSIAVTLVESPGVRTFDFGISRDEFQI